MPFIICSLLLVKQKPIAATVLLTLSLLLKLNALIFFPLLLIIIFKNFKIKKTLLSIIYVIITGLVISLPYIATNKFFALYQIAAKSAVGAFNSLTINAFNFWWNIFGNRANFIGDNNSVFNLITYQQLAILIIIIIYLALIYLYLNQPNPVAEINFLYGAFVSLSIFMFLTRMHERYLYSVFALLVFCLIKFPWVKSVYYLLSVTFFLNLLNYLPIGNYDNKFIHNPVITAILSLINLFVWLYFTKKIFYENRNHHPLLQRS
jgi:Gpi18-like mannosyltransferase